MAYRIRETIQNKGRKFYDSNLRFLDKVLSPVYNAVSYLAGLIIKALNLNELIAKVKILWIYHLTQLSNFLLCI